MGSNPFEWLPPKDKDLGLDDILRSKIRLVVQKLLNFL